MKNRSNANKLQNSSKQAKAVIQQSVSCPSPDCATVQDSYFEYTDQPCGSKVEYYSAYTNPFPTIDMTIANDESSSCTMIAIIKLKRNIKIEITLKPGKEFTGTFDQVKKISLKCEGAAPSDRCTGTIDLNISYCVCC